MLAIHLGRAFTKITRTLMVNADGLIKKFVEPTREIRANSLVNHASVREQIRPVEYPVQR